MKKLLLILLVLVLALSAAPMAGAATNAQTAAQAQAGSTLGDLIGVNPAECLLREVVETLTMDYGIRLWGTPNEYNSLRYLERKFKEIGFAEEDVVFSWWPRSDFENRVIGGVQMPTTYADAFTGRLAFSSGPDIYGLPFPNNDVTGAFATVSGTPIVEIGTHQDYAIPDGVEGDIIAALIFYDAAPHADIIDDVINKLNDENEYANIVGAIVARTGERAQIRGNPNLAPTPQQQPTPVVPVITLPLYWYNEVLDRKDDFQLFERYRRTHSGVTYAIQRAETDDPDAVIIVTAHIDSVLSTRGASDNAAGVAGVMETARRLRNVDNGNIKIIYALVGAEEGGGMLGAVYMAEKMINAGKRDRTININGDMFGSPNPMPAGLPMDSISVHTIQSNAQWARYGLRNSPYNNTFVGAAGSGSGVGVGVVGNERITPAFTLAAWLILNHAEIVPMAQTGWGRYVACPELIAAGMRGVNALVPLTSQEQAWIQNYRNNNFGSTDHIQFANRVIDAASIAIVNDAAHFVEEEYHNAEDTMALNYCYYRNLNATNLMALGVQRAIELNISKRAGFDVVAFRDGSKAITLRDYARLFNVYDRIEVILMCGYDITMSYGDIEYTLSGTDFEIDFIVARGYGIADHANKANLVMFSTLLDVMDFQVRCAYRVLLEAAIARANALVQSRYTVASWTVVTEALTEAVRVLNDNGATPAEIEEAATVLNAAIDALRRRPTGGNVGTPEPGGQDQQQPPPTQEVVPPEVPLAPGDDHRFRDVSAGDWFYDAVNYVYENEIMRGVSDDLFAPNTSFNRAMAATVLFRMAGAEANFVQVFDDVAAGQWYSEAITWAAQNGIVLGIGNNLFDPYTNVTREQLAAMFFRYATFMELNLNTSELTGFVDVADVSYWALEAMSWAVHHEIIQGMTGNRLNPRGTATRAECATIIMRVMETFD